MRLPSSLRSKMSLSLLGFGGVLIALNVFLFDRLDHSVIDLQQKESVRKKSYRRALRFSLIEGAAVILGTAGMWLAWDRYITRRARHIARAARDMHGEGPVTPPLEGRDEIAQISQAVHEAHVRLQRQAAELRAEQDRYRWMVEAMPSMVFVHRGRLIEYINPFGVALMGAKSADELLGVDLYDMIHPDFHGSVASNIERLLQNGGSIRAPDRKFLRPDGTIIYADVSATSFEDDRGRAVQVVVHDMTARKAAEARREALTQELAEKNKELENLLYVASHDFRSPLLNIQGFARQLEREWHKLGGSIPQCPDSLARQAFAASEARVPRALEYIRAGVTRIDALLEGLLRVSRMGRAALDIRPLDPLDVLNEVLSAQHFQIQEAGAMVVIGELPPCRADKHMLGQVLANLLDNAVKYRSPDRPSRISIKGKSGPDGVTYEVADNGLGIPEEERPRVFEIFHRHRPDLAEGQGLGLTLVQRCLARMNGRISLRSREGEGSIFSVTLPGV